MRGNVVRIDGLQCLKLFHRLVLFALPVEGLSQLASRVA